MTDVSALFRERWRSGEHVGDAKPYIEVWTRRGRFSRGYDPWEGHDVGAIIPTGVSPSRPWQATWTGQEGYDGSNWREVPNVLEVRLNQDFDNNGLQTFEIDIENTKLEEATGIAGVYHLVQRGMFAPHTGYRPPNRPSLASAENEWKDVLSFGSQVVIYMGYGEDTKVCVFTGITDEVNLESKPDRMTLIGRDFGKALTDQAVFGWVKDKSMREPVVFADRRHSDKLSRVGGGARASSSRAGNVPRFVLDDEDETTAWISDGHDTRDFTEWVEIRVPRGRYEDFYLRNRYEGQEVYVSVKVPDRIKHGPSYILRQDGTKQFLDEGWLDYDMGDVPGANGGIPYIAFKRNTTKRGRHYRLGNRSLVLADNAIIRLSFRGLGRSSTTGKFHAGVRRFAAIKRVKMPEANKKRWILVNDVSDIVKVVLRWAGFKEWEIEDTGVRLNDKLVFNRGDKLIDIIRKVQELTGYNFFIKPPEGDPVASDTHIGIPVFRESQVIKNSEPVATLRDSDLLTGIKARFTDEPLAWPIRVRGKTVRKDNPQGQRLGADRARRYQSFYQPPWSFFIGFIAKHVVHYEPQLRSKAECHLSARLIALGEGLQSATALVEISGTPELELDEHVMLLDTGTQLSTRLWIAHKEMTFRTGESASWKMSVSGSLVDTPHIVEVINSINEIGFDREDREQKYPRWPARRWSADGYDAHV